MNETDERQKTLNVVHDFYEGPDSINLQQTMMVSATTNKLSQQNHFLHVQKDTSEFNYFFEKLS